MLEPMFYDDSKVWFKVILVENGLFCLSSTEGPRLTHILGLGMLHEICLSGTVVRALLMQKSHSYTLHKPETVVVETMLGIFV